MFHVGLSFQVKKSPSKVHTRFQVGNLEGVPRAPNFKTTQPCIEMIFSVHLPQDHRKEPIRNTYIPEN